MNNMCCSWLSTCWLISRFNLGEGSTLASLSQDNLEMYSNLYLRRGQRKGEQSFLNVNEVLQSHKEIRRKYVLCKFKFLKDPKDYLDYVLSEEMNQRIASVLIDYNRVCTHCVAVDGRSVPK